MGRRFLATILSIAVLSVGVIGAAPSSGATVLSFSPTDDTFVQSTQPTKNFGLSSKLRVDGKPQRHVLMKFVVSGVGTSSISRATLWLSSVEGSPVGGSVYRVASSSWSETSVTWNTAPAADPTALASVGSVTTGVRIPVNVAALVAGDGTYSLKITSSATDGADYGSAEGSASLRPSLEIELAGASDTTPPSVSISSPGNGDQLSGTVDVLVDASDAVGVARVDLLVDGLPAGSDSTSPYAVSWDTRSASNGGHELIATASDAAGNTGTSSPVDVTVSNAGDTGPPTAPTGLSATTSAGPRVDLTWQRSTDDVGVIGYRVIRDGTLLGTTSDTTFTDATVAANTTYGYVVRAEDAAGNLSDPSEPATVITPEPGTSFAFAVAGDLGANAKTAASLAALDASSTDFYLALGDLDYDQTPTDEAWCDYVKAHLPTLGPTYPFELVAGNHEEQGGPDGYILNHAACLPDRLGAVSAPGSQYGGDYYVDFPTSAPLARVIMISPDLTIEGVQRDYVVGSPFYGWLASTIDAARTAGIPWVIVAMHKNCITTGDKSCEIGSDLFNLLVDRRVDLVLQGHDHNYQRSKQLALDAATCPGVSVGSADADCVADDGVDGVYPKGGGTVVTISGSFGSNTYPVSLADGEGPYFAALDGSSSGFTRFVVTAERIDASFVHSMGSFGDAFSIVDGATAGADRTAPSRPASVTATSSASTRIDVAWAPSVDDVAVAGYLVFRNGQLVGTTSTPAFTDTGLVPSTEYSYTIRAYDRSNNVSDPSDAALGTTLAPGTSLSFVTTADATIREAAPTQNFGTTSPVQVDGSPIKHTLLRFEVSGIGSAPVRSARIRLYAVDPSDRGGDAYRAADTSWSESTVNWNTAPAIVSPTLASLGAVAAGSWYELDVTSAITGDGVYTFRLSSISANGADYSSREGSPGFEPTLVVELG